MFMLSKAFQINRIPSLRLIKLRNFSTDSTKTKYRGPVTYLSLGLFAAVGGGIMVYYQIEKEQRSERVSSAKVITTGKAALGGPWSLVDSDGIPQTHVIATIKPHMASYFGSYSLLYFGFTKCPDICPSELVKVGKVMDELERRRSAKIRPIFISVDPLRDTVGQIRHYSQDFHPSMVFLTGTTEQVQVACKAYRVYFSKANENENDDEDYLVDHSIVLYLVSPEGEFLDFFTQRMQVADIVDRIMQHMKAGDAAPAATTKEG